MSPPGMYPKGYKSIYKRDTCIFMFIAVVFTIAQLWHQPRCPTTDEWIKKKIRIHTMEYYSTIKKK
jgi:hypothetical protein